MMRRGPARTLTARRAARVLGAILSALALASCAGFGGRPATAPGATPGATRYTVEALSFEVPSAWNAGGGRRSVRVTHPDEQARLELRVVDQRFEGEKACLEAGTAALARGDATFQNVRRHPSRFAGRAAVAQEADQGGWHGWGWAVCDGGTQYRIFFTARAPVPAEVIETWRAFTKSASIGAAAEGR